MPVVSKLYVCQGTNMAAMNMMKPTPPSAMSGGAENNANALALAPWQSPKCYRVLNKDASACSENVQRV